MRFSLFLLCIGLLVPSYEQKKSPFVEECVTGMYPPDPVERPSVKTYVVNLDVDPQERWSHVVSEKAAGITKLLNTFKYLISAFGKKMNYFIKFLDDDLGYLADTFPAPYGDEMKGIAKATGLPLGDIVFYNIFYEVFTVCTSIVAEDPTGKLFHVRNLDFGFLIGWDIKNNTWFGTEALRPLVVAVDFQKGGKTIYKTVNFAGYVGVFTGMKPGFFTLSINERFSLNGGYVAILEWVLGKRDIHWISFLTRDTLEFAGSYAEAKSKLANTLLSAPAYIILGGNRTGEASIITRSRTKAVDILNLGERGHTWFLLETNFDNWKGPGILDDRRTPGNRCMNKLGQKNVNFEGLFNVLTSRPLLNKGTAYTALMQVNAGTLEAYLQTCPEPCRPY